MKMTVLEAAYIVLCPVGPPLHYKQITERILRRWPGVLGGKTPWHTVRVEISNDIKNNGAKSWFVKTAPATFQLRDPSSVIEAADIVLCAAGKPLHYEKIAERIVRRWSWLLRGKTPGHTVRVTISKDIERHGAKSRFGKTVSGTFGVRWSFPVIEAAYIVLKEARKPLHQNEIAERIRRRRLHPLPGETPGRTAGSAIYMDIKKHGAASRFVKTAPATFGLRGPGDM